MKTPLPASKNKPAQNNPYTETNRLSSRGSSLAFLTRANDEGSAFVFLECTLVLGGTTPQLATRCHHERVRQQRTKRGICSHLYRIRGIVATRRCPTLSSASAARAKEARDGFVVSRRLFSPALNQPVVITRKFARVPHASE